MGGDCGAARGSREEDLPHAGTAWQRGKLDDDLVPAASCREYWNRGQSLPPHPCGQGVDATGSIEEIRTARGSATAARHVLLSEMAAKFGNDCDAGFSENACLYARFARRN